MPQVVACARQSNFPHPSELHFLIHQSVESNAHALRHPSADDKWMSYLWAKNEHTPDGQPTPKPVIPIHGILCEKRRIYKTNEEYMHVEHAHLHVPIDLLTRSNKDLVHPIGIPRKIKLYWNNCKILLYADGFVHFIKANGLQF